MQLTSAHAQVLESLADHLGCERRHFPAGAVLQTRSASPEVLLVLQGHCRILDPERQFGSLTVLRPEAPYLCGVLTLLDPDLSEELIASSACEAIVLGPLPLHPDLEQAVLDLLQHELSPSELPLIQRLVNGLGLNVPADQQTPEIYLRRWQLVPTGTAVPPNGDGSPLIYADRSKEGFRYGQLVTGESLRSFLGDRNPRVLTWSGFDRAGADRVALSSPSRALAPARAIPVEAPARALPQPPELDQSTRRLTNHVRQLGYRPVGGTTPAECHAAVLTMLASLYSLPIRRDNLRRAGQFLADSKGGASLEQVINVADQLGLDGRVVVFRPTEASRLPTPAVILDEDHNPSLIVEANGSGLLLLNPAGPIQRIQQQQLVDHFGSNLRAVAISSGRNTPQKRFGLAWVLPYLSRYKIGLVEVFIASFLAQLFALATPLLF